MLTPERYQRAHTTPPQPPGRAAFPVGRDEVTMASQPKPLRDQIADAACELKLARRDGSAEWIGKASKALDALIDQIPRLPQESA